LQQTEFCNWRNIAISDNVGGVNNWRNILITLKKLDERHRLVTTVDIRYSVTILKIRGALIQVECSVSRVGGDTH